MEGVPIADMRLLKQDREAFVSYIGESFREVGFCGVSHHGIPDDMIQEGFQICRELFMLPASIKNRYQACAESGYRGYYGYKKEVAKGYHAPDLKEFWHIGPERGMLEDPNAQNMWIEEIVGFKGRIYPFYQALENLSHIILEAIALWLDIGGGYFKNKIDCGNSVLRLLHYPPVNHDSEEVSIRAAPHEDINLVTLLAGVQEGLEILGCNNEWIKVPVIDSVIIINTGDMLQRLTNNHIKSTTHRVVNPVDCNNYSRFSMPFFTHFNPSFLIETLPSCIKNGEKNCYPEPIMSDSFLRERLDENNVL